MEDIKELGSPLALFNRGTVGISIKDKNHLPRVFPPSIYTQRSSLEFYLLSRMKPFDMTWLLLKNPQKCSGSTRMGAFLPVAVVGLYIIKGKAAISTPDIQGNRTHTLSKEIKAGGVASLRSNSAHSITLSGKGEAICLIQSSNQPLCFKSKIESLERVRDFPWTYIHPLMKPLSLKGGWYPYISYMIGCDSYNPDLLGGLSKATSIGSAVLTSYGRGFTPIKKEHFEALTVFYEAEDLLSKKIETLRFGQSLNTSIRLSAEIGRLGIKYKSKKTKKSQRLKVEGPSVVLAHRAWIKGGGKSSYRVIS